MGNTIAMVGATGAVGRELIEVLQARDFPCDELRLLASPRSAGTKIPFRGQELEVEVLSEERLQGCDYVFFSAGGGTSLEWGPKAAAAGAVVIDNSSAFRYEDSVPLVVPEVNPAAARAHQGIIANPNCTTILLAVVLGPLHEAAGLETVTVATYQAASGAGAQAMEELRAQATAILAGEPPVVEHFPQPIGFNLFPHIDRFLPEEEFATKEEMKVVWETRKILGLPELAATSTCVRVPTFRAHSEAVFCSFARELSVADARRILDAAPGVQLVDDPAAARYPTPREAEGGDDVLVGRIRPDPTRPRGLSLFLSGDQLLKGAALNAVQIAELLEA